MNRIQDPITPVLKAPVRPLRPQPVEIPAPQPLESFTPTLAPKPPDPEPAPLAQAETKPQEIKKPQAFQSPTTLTTLEDWEEVKPASHPPYLRRTVASSDGGPAWTEYQYPGQDKPSKKDRMVVADDGGPNWRETQVEGKPPSKFRQVPAQDGGKQWSELLSADGSLFRTREVAATDGGNAWREIDTGDGNLKLRRDVVSDDGKADWSESKTATSHTLSRTYTENGLRWRETIEGEKRSRKPADGITSIKEAAVREGTTTLTFDGTEINIHGNLTPTELKHLTAALQAMPANARQYATDISITEALRQEMTPDGKVTGGGAGALAGDGLIAICRGELNSEFNTKRTLYHEAGHIADDAHGRPSSQAPWGTGGSVSQYGKTTPGEDFAEVHRVVLCDFARYQSMTARDWAAESQAEKKMQVAQMYGIQVPTAAQLKAAETPETTGKRLAMDAADAITKGNENAIFIPSQDGGAPWKQSMTGDAPGPRERTIPADDGGSDWTEWQFGENSPFRQRTVPASDAGPEWYEYRFEGQPPRFTRKIPATDGGPEWSETKTADRHDITRTVVEGNTTWKETLVNGQITRK